MSSKNSKNVTWLIGAVLGGTMLIFYVLPYLMNRSPNLDVSKSALFIYKNYELKLPQLVKDGSIEAHELLNYTSQLMNSWDNTRYTRLVSGDGIDDVVASSQYCLVIKYSKILGKLLIIRHKNNDRHYTLYDLNDIQQGSLSRVPYVVSKIVTVDEIIEELFETILAIH